MASKNKKQKRDSNDDASYQVVYSTDPPPPKRCSQCRREIAQCCCPKQALSLKPAVRIERKGRGGKTVTLVEKLPPNEKLLSDLCTYLKRALGTGGTHYTVKREGVIEIQGERRDEVLKLLFEYKK